MIDINRIRNNKEEVEEALLKRMDNVNLDELLDWDIMFTKNLALEWSNDNIKVNCVSPSLTVNTGSYYTFYTDEMAGEIGKNNPSKRLGKLEDTANVVLFLCAEESEYINGENINVNGGILLK